MKAIIFQEKKLFVTRHVHHQVSVLFLLRSYFGKTSLFMIHFLTYKRIVSLNFSVENYSLEFKGLFKTSIYDGSTLIVSVCPAWGVENVCRLYWGIFPLDGKSRKKATSKDGRSDAASILIDSES